jgi:hypothetical protein
VPPFDGYSPVFPAFATHTWRAKVLGGSPDGSLTARKEEDMRKSLIGVVVVAAMLIVGAPRARASKAELEIISGGAIEFVPSVFGHAVTFSLPGSTDLMQLKSWVRCAASPCNRDPLKLTLSGTGFTTPVHLFRNISSVSYMTVGTTKTQEAFWDASNGPLAKTSSSVPSRKYVHIVARL